MGVPRQHEPTRFWDKVDKSGDCWEWTAGRDIYGYGRFKVQDPARTAKAHRWAYAASLGMPIIDLDVEIVRHTCDSPGCVNPAHLEPGSAQDNMTDKVERGRMRSQSGRDNPQYKLTEELRSIIREAPLGMTQADLADRTGLCVQTIRRVRRQPSSGTGQ